ncbi:MAG: S8 family serine peptidase [Fimbriimonas sp.]
MKSRIVQLSLPLIVGATALTATAPRSEATPPQGSRTFDPAQNDLQMGAPVPLGRVVRSPKVLKEIVVRLMPGRSIDRIARESGMRVLRRSLIADAWVLAPNGRSLESALTMVRTRAGVREAFINKTSLAEKLDFVPNDPYFPRNSPEGGPNGGWPGQYYLSNPGIANGDVNVLPAWADDVTGEGVRIGIVDDGFDYTHPDLAPNFDLSRSWDFETNSTNITPREEDSHGTFVTGGAAARGGNGIGISGAAPHATVAGIRIPLTYDSMTEEIGVAAIEYRSTGADRSLSVKNHSYGISYPFITDVNAAAFSRTAAEGIIHVLGAGNSRGHSGQDTNKAMSSAVADVIVAGAMGAGGKFAWYSSFGSNLTTTAYGGDSRVGVLQFSTDRQGTDGYSSLPNKGFPAGSGDYAFGQGTSFTAPVVTGIMALAKQAQPNLTGRWAKHLLARTCRVVDENDETQSGGWTTNGAGIHFNPNYGFGLIDSSALVGMARTTSGVSPRQTWSSPVSNAQRTIPDGGETTVNVSVGQTGPLEEVFVDLKVRHARRGQLEAYLVSPSGTRSRLFIRSNADRDPDIDWKFMSNAFWGENPKGTWRLTLRDTTRGVRGTLLRQSISLNMGQLLGVQP